MKRINTYIHESIKKNKPIYLINDNNVQLNNLKNEIDLVVNISFYTPTILIESIILGFRSICYDYSNIFNFEKKLLEMDKELKKNISNNIDEIILDTSKLFKDISSNKHTDYGVWSLNSRAKLDNFMDGNGKQRIAKKLDDIYNKHRLINIT